MAEIGGACQGAKVGGLLDALRFCLSLLDAIATLLDAIRCCLAASDLKKGSHDREYNYISPSWPRGSLEHVAGKTFKTAGETLPNPPTAPGATRW